MSSARSSRPSNTLTIVGDCTESRGPSVRKRSASAIWGERPRREPRDNRQCGPLVAWGPSGFVGAVVVAISVDSGGGCAQMRVTDTRRPRPRVADTPSGRRPHPHEGAPVSGPGGPLSGGPVTQAPLGRTNAWQASERGVHVAGATCEKAASSKHRHLGRTRLKSVCQATTPGSTWRLARRTATPGCALVVEALERVPSARGHAAVAVIRVGAGSVATSQGAQHGHS